MRLRRAEAADHAAAGAVTVAAYDEFLLGPQDPYRARLADAATRDREAELWVAVPDDAAPGGEVLGCVTLCPEGSPWRELAQPGEGELRMLAVAPAARRQGVGEALASLAIERFRTSGASAVVLCSLDEMAGAHRLYARLGFSRTPAHDWSPAPGVSLLAFRKEL